MKTPNAASVWALFLLSACLGTAEAQQRRALIVTVGEYKDDKVPTFMPRISRDEARQGDARKIREALESKNFGFKSENIEFLSTDRNTPPGKLATRQHILDALNKLRDESQPGDIIVFYFSGHGGRFGEHFSLCPYDANLKKDDNDVKDTELRNWVNSLHTSPTTSTPNVTLILDCCFNEYRDHGKSPRRQPKYMPRPQKGEEIHLTPVIPPDKAVVLRASRDDEEAQQEDLNSQGEWFGIFTYELTKEMLNPNYPQSTYVQLMQRIRIGINKQAALLFNNEFHQTPEMEGAEALQNRALFSPVPKPVVAPQPPVEPGSDTPPHPDAPQQPRPLPPYVVINSVKNSVILLKQGKLSGITSGSEYDLYPETATEFTPQTLAGRMKITRIQDNTALAEILEGRDKISANFRAVETRHIASNTETARLTMRVEAPTDYKAAVEGTLRNTKLAGIASDNPMLILQVTPENGGVKERLYRAVKNKISGQPLAEAIAANPQELADVIKRRLDNLCVLRGLLSLDNPNPGFTVHLQSNKTEYKIGEYPEIHVKIDGAGIAMPTPADRPYYLSLVYVDASGIPYLLYPNKRQADNKIQHNQDILLSSKDSIKTLGYRFFTQKPGGTDTMIAIVTNEPVDWSSVVTMPVEGKPRMILSKSLGTEFADIQNKPTSTWAMAQVTLVIDD